MYGNARHRLLRVLPGFGVAHFVGDLLHCKWLGCDQYFLGGVLWLLVKHIMPDAPAESLKIVFAAIQAEYDVQAVPFKDRYPSLKLTQIKKATVAILPKLNGTGQQCKGLARVMGAVFRQFCDLSDARHIRILDGIKAMSETNRIYLMHRYANRIPRADSEKLIALSFEFCQISTGLVRYYHGRGIYAFHYTLKHHYCLHIALATRYYNPWFSECSSGEDYMKVAKRLVRGSMYGNRISKVANVALRKYIRGFSIERNPEAPWWKRPF